MQGWCGSADPRKRNFDVRHGEAEDMKKEMEEARLKKGEMHQELNSAVLYSSLCPLHALIFTMGNRKIR